MLESRAQIIERIKAATKELRGLSLPRKGDHGERGHPAELMFKAQNEHYFAWMAGQKLEPKIDWRDEDYQKAIFEALGGQDDLRIRKG
jgi:hypothetical protein